MKVLIVLALAAVSAAAKVDYTGHLVLDVVPSSIEQLKFLQTLQQNVTVDFWKVPRNVGSSIPIRVSPWDYAYLIHDLEQAGINYSVQIPNLQKLIDTERQAINQRKLVHGLAAFDFENYHTYEENVAFMKQLAQENTLVQYTEIGTTLEGRPIPSAIVSSTGAGDKPLIYFDCVMHAREWVSTASCVWILNELATSTDPDVKNLIENFDWQISPISNPDGYAFTWSNDRLWRKNRKPFNLCTGVDPNRNFDSDFGGPGTSNNACSDLYHGPSAFSEAESSAMRDLLLANKGRVIATLSIHSAAQMWMSPYGYTSVLPADYAELNRVMELAVNALTATYGTKYTYGNIADVIYLAAGNSADWVYDNTGAKYAYALELRDERGNFQLPPDQILPTAIETFNGIKAMANGILNKP